MFLEPGLDVNAKVFGDEVVGCSAAGDDRHEGAIGDVLHGSERGERLTSLDRGWKHLALVLALGLSH